MNLRLFLIFLLIITAFAANAFINPIPKKAPLDYKPRYGFTYSFEQAEWYGLDPRGSYIKALDEFNVDWVRLPVFWDRMMDVDGNLDFSEIRFAIEEADKRNINVIVALGVKTPFYPEIHLASSMKNKIKFGQTVTQDHEIAQQILVLDEMAVRELSGYKNISHWQIENEPFVGVVDKVEIGVDLITKEVETVRSADPVKRPIILNHAGVGFYDRRWRELLTLLTGGDVFGANAYFKTQGVDLVGFKIFDKEVHFVWPKFFVWPVQSWYFLSPDFDGMKRAINNSGGKFWILEMQAEPYLRDIESANSDQFSFLPADISKGVDFLKSYGVDSIGLWGVNFWQYRESIGDNSWVEEVKALTKSD